LISVIQISIVSLAFNVAFTSFVKLITGIALSKVTLVASDTVVTEVQAFP
jgi:hypothetical protein